MIYRGSAFKMMLALAAAVWGLVCAISLAGAVQGQEAGVEMDFSEKGGGEVQDLIPFDELSPENEKRVRQIIENHTLFVDVKKDTFNSNLRTHEFLFERLPFASKVLRALDIKNYTIKAKGEGMFEADDGSHIKGEFQILYRGDGERIYFGWGGYKTFFLPRVKGAVLFVLLYREIEQDGIAAMENKLYGYIDVDNVVLGFMLKLFNVAFPTVVKSKLSEVFSTGRQVAELITEDPEKVYNAIRDDESFTPQELEEYRAFFMDDNRLGWSEGELTDPSAFLIADRKEELNVHAGLCIGGGGDGEGQGDIRGHQKGEGDRLHPQPVEGHGQRSRLPGA